MPLELALTPKAQADIAAIWDYTLQKWGHAQALKYLSGLDTAFEQLTEFPEMAPLYPEFSPPVRVRRYESHQIAYQFDEASLSVIRILPARMDWAEVLAK